MSKYSPHYQMSQSMNSKQLSKKLQKSKTLNQILRLTNNNPYIQEVDNKSTEKKKRDLSPRQYQPPILLEQNKILLAENRQMALLIHQKNKIMEILQKQAQLKSKQQAKILQEIQSEKQRFINEVIQNKKQTDLHISHLNKTIAQLKQQNYNISKQFHLQRSKQMLQQQKLMHSQLQALKERYVNNISLIDSQKHKIKEDFEKKINEKSITIMEQKLKIDMLTQECSSLKEQIKHFQNIKKIQFQESKSFYETKIQNIHLENRRAKQVFFLQYESQTNKLKDLLSNYKHQIEQLQSRLQSKNFQFQQSINTQSQLQSKIQLQTNSAIQFIRLQYQKDKQKEQNIYKAELQYLQQSFRSQINQLTDQNQRLIKIIDVKNQQNQKMYSQIERIRLNHSQQIRQNQKMFKQLQDKLFSVVQDGEKESQAFKVKLSHLRQADLSALKNWYQNQINILNGNIFEKDELITSNRVKYHKQLRQKVELRKQFNIEVLRYKNLIFQHQSTIKTLNIQLNEQTKRPQIRLEDLPILNSQSKTKIQQMKADQTKQLKSMIEAKDIQIQQLQSKIQLLKVNHENQISLYKSLLQSQKQNNSTLIKQNSKSIAFFQNQIAKYKQILINEKKHLQLQKEKMDRSKKEEIDGLIEEHHREKEELQNIINQAKKMNVQLNKSNQTFKTDKITQQIEYNTRMILMQNKQKLDQLNKHYEDMQTFYLEQIKQKDLYIADLKQQIEELGNDLRDSKENYAELEKKIEQLIQTQSELREMERKVMNLGKQNCFNYTMKQIRK